MQIKNNLSMIVLAVKDFDKSKRFYSEVFGWEIIMELPVVVTFKCSESTELMIYKRENFVLNTNSNAIEIPQNLTSGTELYIFVEHLDTIIERLKKLDAVELSEKKMRDWGDEVAYYADPDGNVVAVAQEK